MCPYICIMAVSSSHPCTQHNTHLAVPAVGVEEVNYDPDVVLGEEVEHLRAVSEETLDDYEDMMGQVCHFQLRQQDLQHRLGGKLTAVLMVATDHSSCKKRRDIIIACCL